MKKIPKGSYGYTDSHKRRQILLTVVLFIIPAAVFAVGLVTTGTKLNYFTIIAVVGVLPACKETVNVIMFLKLHSVDEELYRGVESRAGGLTRGYELVLTTYKVNYPLESFVICGNDVAAYTSGREDLKALNEHISTTMKNNGLKNIHFHAFTDFNAYLDRVGVLAGKGPDDTVFSGDERYDGMRREDVVKAVLLALSL